tara:strand:- start:6138 stop:6671 length:534 start_codon:yes stop_codon:yes gene_type:complete
MKELNRADGISIFKLDEMIKECGWERRFPEKYRNLIYKQKNYFIFLVMLRVEANAHHPDLEFYANETRYTKQTCSRVLNALVKQKLVIRGRMDGDERNVVYYLEPKVREELMEIFAESQLATLRAYEEYLTNDVTAKLLTRYITQLASDDHSEAAQVILEQRLSWMRKQEATKMELK